jgi:outer membrane protein TolC
MRAKLGNAVIPSEVEGSRVGALRFRRGIPRLRFAALGMTACCLAAAKASHAITLETVLQKTLEKNPAIAQAKSDVEQAAGRRLVFRSIAWPSARLNVPAGVQGGHRAGESTKGFGFARGAFGQPILNAAIAPSFRRGDVDVLIAQQQLNVTVTEQLHAARLAFYSALYNRALQTLREEQRQRLDQNVASQKQRYEAGLTDRSAFTGATVQARELDSQIESARRALKQAQLELALAMGDDPSQDLPEPEGDLEFSARTVDLKSETKTALEHRPDLQLARELVHAANQDQRIIEAGYYPAITANISGQYIPVTGIHREGSTRRTDDFISSETREGAGYTWRVIDSGMTTGAVRKARAAREINEVALQKLETNVSRELMRIRNDLLAIEARHNSLASAENAAEESTRTVEQNLSGGLASELEYRLTQNGYLETRSGLLSAAYFYNVAIAEWDRATGHYFQFSEDTPQNVH